MPPSSHSPPRADAKPRRARGFPSKEACGRARLVCLVAVTITAVSACRNVATPGKAPSAPPARASTAASEIVVHDYRNGLVGVQAASPDVRLGLGRDSTHGAESVLIVEYPPATSNPAGRDVRLDAATADWSAGRAISFRIQPGSAIRLSVSFLDRNGVVYTAWEELEAGRWQTVRLPFGRLRPNPYFQPPGAKTGAPIDVSHVTGIAFAPQSPAAGRLAITRIVIVP